MREVSVSVGSENRERESHHPSWGCTGSDAVGCLQRLLPGRD